jgi:colanic acid/amylovoran biosynthesis glycosyltransferase
MDAAHVFVLASVTAADGDEEGTPVSLLEAQASGLPVVSTLHAGIPEIVTDGVSGRLVEERDADALAASLRELATQPQRWERMGRAGRERIEESYDAGRCVEALEAIYREAIAT